MKVCILAAGLGSRLGAVSDYLHKALLPVGNEAVLSHIFRSFPKDSEFVIAVGNKASQIRAFVKLVHPSLKVTFVPVDPFKGPGSGPGFSLYSCREHLQEPFVFIACDTLISTPLPPLSQNWIGVAKVSDPQNWCTPIVDSHLKVSDFEYKMKGSTAQYAFTGIAFVQNYQEFWESLAKPNDKNSEIQVNDGLVGLIPKKLQAIEVEWHDTGNWQSYENLLKKFDKNLTFIGKTTEFTYRYADRIVKVYDSAGKALRCFQRAQEMGDSAPKMIGQEDSVLAYSYVEGDLLSDHLNGIECTQFLTWLQNSFWQNKEIDREKFQATLYEFYIEKTLQRLKLFREKHPDLIDMMNQPVDINGLVCEPAENLVQSIENQVCTAGCASVFHGDLHADNIIKTKSGYRLIDWRESFSGLNIGDRYYDLAKFLHTLDLSVKTMDKMDFQIKKDLKHVKLNHAVTYQELDARDSLWKFLKENKYDRKRTELINALIFLNMSPLYDRELGSYLYYLGRYQLKKISTTSFL